MNLSNGNLENIILNALWYIEENDQENIDVSDIQDRINSGNQSWAYTTVKTVLDRLVEKNIIERLKEGKKYYYKSLISRKRSGEEAVKKLAKQYFNGDMEDLLKTVEKVCNEAAVLV